MKKIPLVLFVSGTLLEICGFLADRVENVPVLLDRFAPKYAHAQNGLERLKMSAHLSKKDDGFAEIEELLLRYVEHENPHIFKAGLYRISDFYITGDVVFGTVALDRGFSTVNFRVTSDVPTIPVQLKSKDFTWRNDLLISAAESLKSHPLFVFSSCLFAGGLVLGAVGFWLEQKDDNKKS